MPNEDLLRRGLRVAEQLSRNQGWNLTLADQHHYVETITDVATAPFSEDQLRLSLLSYHADHHLVAALTSPTHPDHDASWQLIGEHVRRILASKDARHALGDSAQSLDDIAQEALADLWRGLPGFRYQSRLQTWVFTVVDHCIARAVRAQQTQRRGSLLAQQSLDLLEREVGDAIQDDRVQTPDEISQLHALEQILAKRLAQAQDKRLGVILQLWAVEQQTLREIGAQLNLSVGRIHRLLTQTKSLLQADPHLQAWVAEE